MLLATALLTFFTVLFCNIYSKFSLIKLIQELNDARAVSSTDMGRYSTVFSMIFIIIVIPQMLTFGLCVWQSLYAAVGNNPWPSGKAMAYNVLQALLEVLGLCTFVFGVAGHIEAAMVLAMMPGLSLFWALTYLHTYAHTIHIEINS